MVIKLTRPPPQLSCDLIVRTDALICFSVTSEEKARWGMVMRAELKGKVASNVDERWASGLTGCHYVIG